MAGNKSTLFPSFFKLLTKLLTALCLFSSGKLRTSSHLQSPCYYWSITLRRLQWTEVKVETEREIFYTNLTLRSSDSFLPAIFQDKPDVQLHFQPVPQADRDDPEAGESV